MKEVLSLIMFGIGALFFVVFFAAFKPDVVTSHKQLKILERVKGIEPSYSAWKAAALPLSYTRARTIN